MSKSSVLISVHGYAGDAQQIRELLPFYEHHHLPIVIVSPVDSPIERMGPHICVKAGGVGYIGQVSWDRQHLQLKALLQFPQEWFLLHDSDSFVVEPKLPDYLFEDKNVIYSNEVDDFRKPGEIWPGNTEPWPMDYHKGYPLKAFQPPYFLHRSALEKIVKSSEGLVACPICPFIDWQMVVVSVKAGIKHLPFRNCASCETKTPMGIAVMTQCIERGATFLHSIKSGRVATQLKRVYEKAKRR